MDKEGTAQAFRNHQAPDVSLVLISTVIALTVYFVINRWWRRERWEKYGVKHVNVGMYTFPEARNRFLMARPELTVGFSSDTPVLITRDLDLLKQILVKDFNNFSNRGTPIPTKSPLGQGLFFLNDSDWKRIRQLMSPSFSTGKLKRISIHVQDAANRLSEVFQKCAETGTNLKLLHTTGQYTSSIIAKTAFGVAADSIGQEEDDQFTYFVKNIFKKRSKHSPIFLAILLAFPRFRRFLTFTLGLYFPDPITSQSTDYFQAILKETIAEREVAERQGSRHVNNDFLQSLVSTMVASEEKTTAEDKSEEKKTPISNGSMNCSTSPKKTISTQEIIAQSVLTIFAAYETTASTLQFCLYKLAQNPEVQEKVYEEILAVVEHEDPTHEELAKLNYMGQVIDETLRLFPPLVRIRRQAVEARTYGPITIPAGANVEIPIKEIHRDPSHYPDPEVFDPDRFSAENKSKRNPLAFIPFGQGPRLCIGMRLAYLELKIALVQVLRKVKVELNDTTVPRKGEEITTTYTLIFPRSKEPIELAVKFRGE
ncbi:hypothetical protein EGW08_017271 [Elysia chlorotica]|uniref:Cytochrome P450 n=1 Tax=Elysia chlorotica TaxID=188477 RepID=A0A3S0ZD19_ELYCH|nr:hypothetical protein EGW08_017271 [Elysia chlorotica]